MKTFTDRVIAVSRKNQKMINEACKPLLDHFGINYFYYFHVTNDGKYSFFSNHIEWNEYGFKQKLYQEAYYAWQPWNFPFGESVHRRGEEPLFHLLQQNAEHMFGISYLFALLSRDLEGLEGYGFGLQPFKEKENYLAKVNLLKLFIKQFNLKYRGIFEDLQTSTVDLTRELGAKFYKKQKPISCCNYEPFLQEIGLAPEYALSAQENRVCTLLACGCTARQIAEQLELSPRTIEAYIEKIKTKLSCFSKTALTSRCIDLNSVAYFENTKKQ